MRALGRRRLARSLLRRSMGRLGVATVLYYLPSVCVLGQWAPMRLESLPAGVCRWRGPSSSKAVALTFDDGPSPDTTPRTLELLDALGMKATFFVLGSLVEAHPGLVSEILRRGHGVGLHGRHHRHHTLHRPRWVRRDTDAAVRTLGAAGVRPRWYRPPYGQLTAGTVLEARRHGMEVVLWSIWGREWAEADPETVMARLSPGLEPGAVVLLHDSDTQCPPGTAARTWRVLEMLAPALAERGLRAVTLDELVGTPVPAPVA